MKQSPCVVLKEIKSALRLKLTSGALEGETSEPTSEATAIPTEEKEIFIAFTWIQYVENQKSLLPQCKALKRLFQSEGGAGLTICASSLGNPPSLLHKWHGHVGCAIFRSWSIRFGTELYRDNLLDRGSDDRHVVQHRWKLHMDHTRLRGGYCVGCSSLRRREKRTWQEQMETRVERAISSARSVAHSSLVGNSNPGLSTAWAMYEVMAPPFMTELSLERV